jgi:DNA-binding MarR family transcriptional regulator
LPDSAADSAADSLPDSAADTVMFQLEAFTDGYNGGVKLTVSSAKPLRAFLNDPALPRYGTGLCADLDMRSGTLFPILNRLEAAGLLISEREQADPVALRRPLRVYYRLTGAGERFAREELAALADQLQLLAVQLRPPSPAGARNFR